MLFPAAAHRIDEIKIPSCIIAQYTAVNEVRCRGVSAGFSECIAPSLDQEWIAEKYERAEHPLDIFKIEQRTAIRLSGIQQMHTS
jgi:hypothetical protein